MVPQFFLRDASVNEYAARKRAQARTHTHTHAHARTQGFSSAGMLMLFGTALWGGLTLFSAMLMSQVHNDWGRSNPDQTNQDVLNEVRGSIMSRIF